MIVLVLVRGVMIAGWHDSHHSNDSSNFSYSPTTGAPAPPGSTGDNPLLAAPGAPLAAAKCAYTPWSSTDVTVARTFFETAATCLQNEWQPVLSAAHIPFTAPKLNVSASTAGITTKCTGSSNNFAAFYCGADQTIYMPLSQLQTDMFGNHWEIYLSVFAHEYGHHVQALAGILSSANKQRRDAGATSPAGLELSRRIELQANCFDGMYLASSTSGGGLNQTQARNAKQDAYGRGDAPGDMRDHGTSQHMGDWWTTGFDKNKTAQCNTFTASDGDVS
ncbi:hypothetical protein EBN03_07910 [Nocardia stercoris]|uniref:Metalloprotease n=1 Tax=Nocardia stercoris TaxID=2483361 RepID=A0A3M2LA49_9NOCA|nr:hypothetical protein EBN03_07910 [Nocardia stercoris]